MIRFDNRIDRNRNDREEDRGGRGLRLVTRRRTVGSCKKSTLIRHFVSPVLSSRWAERDLARSRFFAAKNRWMNLCQSGCFALKLTDDGGFTSVHHAYLHHYLLKFAPCFLHILRTSSKLKSIYKRKIKLLIYYSVYFTSVKSIAFQ